MAVPVIDNTATATTACVALPDTVGAEVMVVEVTWTGGGGIVLRTATAGGT